MAKKKEENGKIKNELNNIENKTLTELLELKEATKFLVDYYGNFAKANEGKYEFNSEEIYKTAKNLSEKYNKGYNNIISVIEDKINKELFK